MQSPNRHTVPRLLDRLIDGARWMILVLPLFFALPGIARADAALAYASPEVADTLTYSEAAIFSDDDQDLVAPTSALASFGPFRVTASDRVDMDGVVESDSPARFAALLRRYPGIQTLVMHDCPGSDDDDANLALARMVHRAGIDTLVPADGSIRSGAVELFLAGKTRHAQPGAEIGVHSWVDENGFEATDFPPTDPVHSAYIRYYIDMGMDPAIARAFYDFTNRAAPSSGVHFMTLSEVRKFGLITPS
jgi:hypothetical protein